MTAECFYNYDVSAEVYAYVSAQKILYVNLFAFVAFVFVGQCVDITCVAVADFSYLKKL